MPWSCATPLKHLIKDRVVFQRQICEGVLDSMSQREAKNHSGENRYLRVSCDQARIVLTMSWLRIVKRDICLALKQEWLPNSCLFFTSPWVHTMALFASLIIRTFQLVFLAGTVFSSHNKSSGTIFRLIFSAKRTGPLEEQLKKEDT